MIHTDVHKAMQEFFLGVPPPGQVAASLITLNPKVANPQTFSDYKHICLTKFLSKVITQIIATQLSSYLPRLISPKQAGFLKGRDITEQTLLAQEMIHVMDRTIHGGHVIVKLDMAKAFDRVSWSYLRQIL